MSADCICPPSVGPTELYFTHHVTGGAGWRSQDVQVSELTFEFAEWSLVRRLQPRSLLRHGASQGARRRVAGGGVFFLLVCMMNLFVRATAAAADRRALIQRRAARRPARRARRLGPYNCTTDCLPYPARPGHVGQITARRPRWKQGHVVHESTEHNIRPVVVAVLVVVVAKTS